MGNTPIMYKSTYKWLNATLAGIGRANLYKINLDDACASLVPELREEGRQELKKVILVYCYSGGMLDSEVQEVLDKDRTITVT